MGHLDGVLVGQAVRKQLALQGQDHAAFAREAAGVVDAQGGACGELLGQRPVVVVEGCGITGAVEAGDSLDDSAGQKGYGDEGVDVAEQLFRELRVLGEPARGGLQTWFQHCLPAGQTTRLGRGRAEVDPLAHGGEGPLLVDAMDDRTPQVAAWVGGFLAAQYGFGQVDGHEVGQSRHGRLGEFPGGDADVQGGADAGAGLGQQFQAASGGEGVLPHKRLSHQHQSPRRNRVSGVMVRLALGDFRPHALARGGHGAGCGVGQPAGRRGDGEVFGRQGPGILPVRRGGRDEGGPAGKARQYVDLLRDGEGFTRWETGENGFDGDALDPGGARHRTGHERDPPTARQRHLDSGTLTAGDQLGCPLHDDRPVTRVQLKSEVLHPDSVPCAGLADGVPVRPQQSTFASGALPQQSALDGVGRPANHGGQRRILGAARIAEAQDALDPSAERVAEGKRAAGARLGAFGEVLGTVDPDELPLHQGETDAVGTGHLLGEDESRGALDRREVPGQGRGSESAHQDRAVRVGEGDVHLAAREPGLEPGEDGSGRADDRAVRIEVVTEGQVRPVRREAQGAAAVP